MKKRCRWNIKRCNIKWNVVITNDTGPMHFAISFHTPVIAIFGPTPPNYAVDKNRSPSLIAMRAKAVCPGSNKCTIFNSMDKERAEEIRQICNKKNQICTDMITVESVTCVAQRVLSASCFSISWNSTTFNAWSYSTVENHPSANVCQ